MQTYTGRRFWPFDPRPDEVSILDVAHHLSMDCRFGGAVLRFYSVAQHSVLVSRLVEAYDPALGPHALLHDAHEAYHRDRTRPAKRSLKWLARDAAILLSDAENECQRAIETHVGLAPLSADAGHMIHLADVEALATERRDLLVPTDDEWPILDGVRPWPHLIEPLGPARAEAMFLEWFAELFPGVAVS